MEVVGYAVRDDSVAGVVPTLSSRADFYLGAQDVDKLAFAFIAY